MTNMDLNDAPPKNDAIDADLLLLAQDRKLAHEAMTWRLKTRALEKEVAKLKGEAAARDAGAAATNSNPESSAAPADGAVSLNGSALVAGIVEDVASGDQPDDSFLADLRDRVVVEALESAGAMLPTETLLILTARNQVAVTEDGDVSIVINGTPQPLTPQSLEKVLPLSMLRAAGVQGTGSRGSRLPVNSSLDWSRINDGNYFRAHREEFRAQLKGKR